MRVESLRSQLPRVSPQQLSNSGEHHAFDHHPFVPAVLFVEFGEPLNRAAIDPNCSGLPVQTEAWDFGRLQVVGHSDNIDSESLEFLRPLTLEVGHGGSNNVSKLISSVNPGQSEGSQQMGTCLAMSQPSEAHVYKLASSRG